MCLILEGEDKALDEAMNQAERGSRLLSHDVRIMAAKVAKFDELVAFMEGVHEDHGLTFAAERLIRECHAIQRGEIK